MEIINAVEQIPRSWQGNVLTIGNFDGVHLGHQRIIKAVTNLAAEFGCEGIVMTFEPHPLAFLKPELKFKYILALKDRLALIADQKIRKIIVAPFNHALANLTPDRFLKMMSDRLAPRTMIVGHDFRFGRDRTGDFAYMQSLAAQVHIAMVRVPALTYKQAVVSSSRIRRAIERGELAEAAALLGRYHFLRGLVVPDRQVGTSLGFPTANIIMGEIVTPPDGVYLSYASYGESRRRALTYLGTRPTFGTSARVCETYLLEGGIDLYGQELTVQLITLIRGDQKFADTPSLIAQIERDRLAALQLFERLQPIATSN